LAWESIKTAPTNRRVLVCDDKGKVFVARASTLRWRDEADRLIDREAPAAAKPRGRKSR
jgi:hypothetical protein